MKYENEMFQDLMGIVIEADDPWLNKKLNNHVCYKGGGGGTTTTTPQIAEEFKPFASAFGGKLTTDMDKFGQVGDESQNLLEARKQALGMTDTLSAAGADTLAAQRQAATGTGMFAPADIKGADLSGVAKEMARQAGIGEAQAKVGDMASGTMGSARQRIAADERDAALRGQLAGLGLQDFQRVEQAKQADLAARRGASQQAVQQGGIAQKAAMGGVDVMRGVGTEETKRGQFEADAFARGMQQIGSIFSGIPQGSTSVQSGGGK